MILRDLAGAGAAELADFRALTDVALRRRVEPAEGVFIAEGAQVIRRALAAGYPPRRVLCEARWLDGLRDALEAWDIPVFVGAPDRLAELTGYAVHRGALASFERTALPQPAELLARSRLVAVLEDVNDHTNTGLIFRSAAALGVDAVLLSASAADPLYRRAVRTSMGAVLTLPYARLPSGAAGREVLRSSGHRLLALTPDPRAVPLPDLRAADTARCALLLGAEGSGLSREMLELADVRVRIPMAREVDSLNVAAAAAVAFYALSGATSA